MLRIFKQIEDSDFISSFIKKEGRFVVVDSLSLAIIASSVFNKKKQRILINCPNLYSAQEVYEHLINFVGDENLLFFPQDEIFRVDVDAYSKEMLLQRLFVMEESLKKEPKILICHSASLTRFLPSLELFKSNILLIEKNKSYNIKEIINHLVRQGYTRVNKIDGQLQYALRGDILDIYLIDKQDPIRIEFFDDEVESIRFFNISNQLSIEEIDKVTIFPANDILLTQEEITK